MALGMCDILCSDLRRKSIRTTLARVSFPLVDVEDRQVSLQNWEGDVPRRSGVLASCYILNVWSPGSIRTKTQAKKDVISRIAKIHPTCIQHTCHVMDKGNTPSNKSSMRASKEKVTFP